jgi:GDPmannose 4,6-dehydratase
MWIMLQQEEPDDFVIATGKTHSVKEFLQTAFDYVDLDYHDYLTIDNKLYRPSEVNILQGNASKARNKLNWVPKTSFEELVHEMVDGDINWYSN